MFYSYFLCDFIGTWIVLFSFCVWFYGLMDHLVILANPSSVPCIGSVVLCRESSLADILEGIPPTFSRKPKAVCVDEGRDVELESRLVAVPEPQVTWFCNGKEITTSGNVSVTSQSDIHMYTNIVRIKKIKKSQEGSYEVVAKNREGEAAVQLTVKVTI